MYNHTTTSGAEMRIRILQCKRCALTSLNTPLLAKRSTKVGHVTSQDKGHRVNITGNVSMMLTLGSCMIANITAVICYGKKYKNITKSYLFNFLLWQP